MIYYNYIIFIIIESYEMENCFWNSVRFNFSGCMI